MAVQGFAAYETIAIGLVNVTKCLGCGSSIHYNGLMPTHCDKCLGEAKVKIPESQRPPMSACEVFLTEVSRDLREHFVEDFQNDCACKVETYDVSDVVLFHDGTGVRQVRNGHRVGIPLHPRPLTDADIQMFLLEACKVRRTLQYRGDTVPVRGIHPPTNWDFFIDPQCFGYLSVNLYGWGLFCFPGLIHQERRSDSDATVP